jgi:hypothetical protein
MKKVVLLVAFMVAACGAYADTPSTQTETAPEAEIQVAETIEATPAEETLSCQPEAEVDTAFDLKKSKCPLGAPSCTPFNLEPCDDYCGPGFGACYRFCCVCTG